MSSTQSLLGAHRWLNVTGVLSGDLQSSPRYSLLSNKPLSLGPCLRSFSSDRHLNASLLPAHMSIPEFFIRQLLISHGSPHLPCFPIFKDHCLLSPDVQCRQILWSFFSTVFCLFHMEGRFNSCYSNFDQKYSFYLFLYYWLETIFHLLFGTSAAKQRSTRRNLKSINLRGSPALEQTQAKLVLGFASSI